MSENGTDTATGTPTVRDVLTATAPAMRARLGEDGEGERFLEIADAGASVLEGVTIHGAADRVLELLDEMLDIPLPGVLASAWRRYEPFLEYANPEAHPPGAVHQIPLAEHTVDVTWHPAVEVVVDGVGTLRIEFEARIVLELEGAIVTIRDGRFRSVRVGRCEAEGSVQLGELVLAERPSTPIELPMEFDLGAEGIPILPGGSTPDHAD